MLLLSPVELKQSHSSLNSAADPENYISNETPFFFYAIKAGWGEIHLKARDSLGILYAEEMSYWTAIFKCSIRKIGTNLEA